MGLLWRRRDRERDLGGAFQYSRRLTRPQGVSKSASKSHMTSGGLEDGEHDGENH